MMHMLSWSWSLAASLLQLQADENAVAGPPEIVSPKEKVVAPQFPGGLKSLKAYIKLTMNYPAKAKKNLLGGRVSVDCLIDREGRVTEVRVNDGIDPELDAEAVRICRLLPRFIPGTDNGEPAEFWVVVPVDFILD